MTGCGYHLTRLRDGRREVASTSEVSMKRFPRILAGAVVATLALAAGAYAWHGGFSSAASTSATFLANTVANSSSQTCTAANNDSIQVSDATYTGIATSTDTNLNGPITIFAHSVYDATTNVGTVSGEVTIGSGGASGFFGRLVVVNAGGHLQGLVVGSEAGGGQVLGNVTSSFSTTSGFGASGSPAAIGGNAAGTDTAIVSTGSCAPMHQGDNDGDDDDQGGGGGGDKFAGAGSFSGPMPFHTLGKLGSFGFGRNGDDH
jgi:hypothetical protein